jgi:high-affinity Fe2+/Pb2+ permease
MSVDALLWICTLLFAAAMLILSAMRHAEANAEADADPDENESRQAC